jgi:hypothetical protein
MAEWAGLDRTPILKMLVVRCLRPDRSVDIYMCMYIYIKPHLILYTISKHVAV